MGGASLVVLIERDLSADMKRVMLELSYIESRVCVFILLVK